MEEGTWAPHGSGSMMEAWLAMVNACAWPLGWGSELHCRKSVYNGSSTRKWANMGKIEAGASQESESTGRARGWYGVGKR